MLLLVKVLLIIFILVIDVPSSDGGNAVTQQFMPVLGAKRVFVTTESQQQYESQRCAGVTPGGPTQASPARTQTNKYETQFPRNQLRTRGIEPEDHTNQIKVTEEPRLSNEGPKTKVLKNQLPTNANEAKENEPLVKPVTIAKRSRKIRPQPLVNIQMRTKQRDDFQNDVSSLRKREQRQSSVTEKLEGGHPILSSPKTSSKLKETLHSLTRSFSKAKRIVKLPQSITRSVSSPKQFLSVGRRGSKSPKPDMNNPYTSGHAQKPSGAQKFTTNGLADRGFSPKSNQHTLSPERTKATEGTISRYNWLPKEYQPEIPGKVPPSPPHLSPENEQQTWDIINSKKNLLFLPEMHTYVLPTEQSETTQLPGLRSSGNSIHNDPNQRARPPSPPKPKSPEAKNTDSDSEGKRRAEAYIRRNRSQLEVNFASLPAQDVQRQSPPKPPSPRRSQPQSRVPSLSSSSSSSPETTSGDPIQQLRRKLSLKDINDQYNTIANKIKMKE